MSNAEVTAGNRRARVQRDTRETQITVELDLDGTGVSQLATGVPCGFGVLTVDSMAQALDRVQGGAKRDTGAHAVRAALASLAVKERLAAGAGELARGA